jgi:Biotin-lipoyl like
MAGKHPNAQRYCQLLRTEAPGGHRHPMRLACHLADGRSLTNGARAGRARSGRLAHTLGGLLAMAMMVLIGGCQEAAMVAAPPEPPEVQVTQVVQKDVPIYSEWVGTAVGYVTAQIRARITGYLMSQQYTEGSFVKTGDVLFRIDPRPYQRAVKKLEITVPAAVTPNYMERLGTDGRFREASSQRHGMLTPRWKGQSSEIPTSPGSLTGAEAGYRPETPRPLPPPGEHRLPPRTPVLTTAGA